MTETFWEMDQFIGLQLNQDWVHDYEDPYDAAEAGILERPAEYLLPLHREISRFFQVMPDQAQRFDCFSLNGAFPDEDSFDSWLLAVRGRIEQELAGIRSAPLLAPPGFYDEPG